MGLAGLDEPTSGLWGSPVEKEIRRRIIISVAAYAYEFENTEIMPDAVWDFLAGKVQRHMATGRPALDRFFATEFSPMTGMWIRDHPELDGIKRTFDHYSEAMGHYFGKGLKKP